MFSKIVLATRNPGKVREFQKLFDGFPVTVVPESDFNVASPVETGTTFVENAIIKARNAARHTGLPALADDSGIAVDCLNGQPGIYSSRYAGENATDEANLDKLLREVSRFPEQERTARYWCILAFMRHAEDPTPVICQAYWKGRIILEKRGQNGFGYDPSFLIPVLGQTAAELDPDVKNRLSHRGQALARLREALLEICAGE